MAALPRIKLSNSTFIETAPAGTVIGALIAEGGSASANWSYKLEPNDLFEIKVDPVTRAFQVVTKVAGNSFFDFENAALKEFTITIDAEDTKDPGTFMDGLSFTISVTDNTAPTDITLTAYSVEEHVANGTEVGILGVVDADKNDTFTYTLLKDGSNGGFAIVAGKLVVADGSKLDYLTASSHSIVVEVKDTEGNAFQKTVAISVSDAYNVISGTSKNNKINGTSSADSINGGAGNDKINGLAGDDLINGGAGKDILTGGAGMDTFVFDTPVKKGHFDQITDFKSADDTIQISLASLKSIKVKVAKQEVYDDLMGTKAGKKKASFGLDKVFEKGKPEKKFFTIGKSKDSDDFVTYDKKTGFVYLDLDGSGKGKGFAIAKLKPGTSVSVDDFLFI